MISSTEFGLHGASIRHVGEAMEGWDTDIRGGFWVPTSSGPSTDLPPLRLEQQDNPPVSSE